MIYLCLQMKKEKLYFFILASQNLEEYYTTSTKGISFLYVFISGFQSKRFIIYNNAII